MHRHGATSKGFGWIVVSLRAFAAANPAVFYYEPPTTLEDKQNSRMISDPLRLFDYCMAARLSRLDA